jgi:ABC-type enterochelin transport system substrate-binding protein
MRPRHTAALTAATLLLTLTACATETPKISSDSTTAEAKGNATPSAAESIDKDAVREAAGIPKDPTGQARTDYLAALKAIDPWFVTDKGEEDAIDNGVNQCSSLDVDKAVWAAQQRFGTPDRPVTEAEASEINQAVRKYICP